MQALFALTFPVGKWGLSYADPLVLTGGRMLIAGFILLIWSVATQNISTARPISRNKFSDIWLFFKTTIFYIYLTFVPEFWALKSMSSLKNNMMWSATPFITALLSYYLIHERLTRQQWLGMLIGTLGVVPLLYVSSAQEIVWGEFMRISLPELMMFIAVGSAAYAWFLVKELYARGYTILFINGVTMLVGGSMSLLTKYIFDYESTWYTQLMPTLVAMIALVFISNVAAYTIYGYLLRYHSVTFLSFSGFLCPLFGALFGWLILGERVYVQYVVSFIFIITGLVLFYRSDLLKKLQSH